MSDIYTADFSIMVRHCDREGKLFLHELFRFMQDCAISHAHVLGVGMDTIETTGKAFVLSRVKLNVLKMPVRGSELNIRTYPSGIERIFFIRDFEIFCDGKLCAYARTLWLYIDIETRMPDRMLARNAEFKHHVNEKLGLTNPQKPVLEPMNDKPAIITEVRHTDIDVMGHVNNACYIKWISDCLGHGFFSEYDSYCITANFTSEMKEGETALIGKSGTHFIVTDQNGRETFRASVGEFDSSD